MPLMAAGLLLAALAAAVAAASPYEAVVGDVRVQAISPSLIRIELRGPRGFEDRSTFMVPNRSALRPGVGIRVNRSSADATLLTTAFYNIHLEKGGFLVTSPAGRLLLQSTLKSVGSLLRWPAPLEASAYAISDYPRFVVPPWGPTPIPQGQSVDPELPGTHGYDFRNNQAGDTYIFLLGDGLDGWASARQEFLALTGPIPVLPDYAYGIWYTRYVLYTEAEAKEEINNFTLGRFPLDVYGLDMNWRQYKCGSYIQGGGTSPCCQQMPHAGCPDRSYDYPNSTLFPDFSEWFEYLRAHGLRSYFNDHPFPVDMQTKPAEVAFRWNGLTKWLTRGLDFWWFDRNWEYSIQPPNLPVTTVEPSWEDCQQKGVGSWEGLSNIVWGSHVYFSIAESWIRTGRPGGERPLLLSRDSEPNWRPGMDSSLQAGVPAHHRYPVWWLGDGVPIEPSIARMVDEGIHSFRPFVHPDCGGNGFPPAPTFLRWVQHCVFAPIVRFHAGDLPPGDHRFWIYDSASQAIIRDYLQLRARLAPALVAAGRAASASGFPLLARCDLFWPEHPPSRSNLQYMFLNDTLVAPFYVNDTLASSPEPGSMTPASRVVWIPPGEWQDAWNGSQVSGPRHATVTLGSGRIPLWHRLGGMVVLAPEPGLRVSRQDWSRLVLEVFPPSAATASVARRTLLLGDGDQTRLHMWRSEDRITVRVEGEVVRAWALRLHLRPGERSLSAVVDGEPGSLQVLEPLAAGDAEWEDCAGDVGAGPRHGLSCFFPLAGPGARPAPGAGPVAEVLLKPSASPRTAELFLAPAPVELLV